MQVNSDIVVKRALSLARTPVENAAPAAGVVAAQGAAGGAQGGNANIGVNGPGGALPANQTVIDLIARAVNPLNLAATDALWMPYL